MIRAKEIALAFLRETNQIPRLDESEIAENKLIHHRIKFDTNEIMSIAPELAEFVLDDPNHGEFEFGELIQNELLRLHEKYFQVCTKVELVSLPRGYGGVIKNHKDLPPFSKPSMPFMFQGQLIGKSKKIMQTMTSRFLCQNVECAANQRKHTVDLPFPEKSKNSPRCFFCQSFQDEILESREMSYYVLADFKPLGNTDAKIDEFATFKIVTSIDYLALGQNYVIIGRANGDKDVTFYECIHWSPLENVLSKFLGMKIELHPELYKILSKASGCPWSFVNYLTIKVGSHIAPEGTFHHLKLGILLSLAVSKADPEAPNQLPLMVALLENTDFPINLLHYGLSLLEDEQEKPIIHSESQALTCQAVKKEKKVFAGSLILAKDTVCYLGELTKYKKDALDSIKSVLESGVIVTLSPQEEDVSQESYPIMATIWTHCSITATKAGKGQMGGSKQQTIKHFCTAMKQFIDVFGTLYICSEEDREIPPLIRHLFSRSGDGVSLDKAFHFGLKMLISQARQKNLVMEPEATLLVKKYFVASRRARAKDGVKGNDMPLKALQTMTAMAEGHAKLSLRNSKVSVFDAVAAIKLYEENIAVQCGYSFIELQKTEFETFTEEMMHFWNCLDDFIGVYVGDLTFTSSTSELPEE